MNVLIYRDISAEAHRSPNAKLIPQFWSQALSGKTGVLLVEEHVIGQKGTQLLFYTREGLYVQKTHFVHDWPSKWPTWHRKYDEILHSSQMLEYADIEDQGWLVFLVRQSPIDSHRHQVVIPDTIVPIMVQTRP